MGASRPSQNIFFYLKDRRNWKHVWYLIKHFNKVTYGDTFGPILCKIFGHKIYTHPSFEKNEYACRQCNRYIPQPTSQEIDAALYDKEVEAYALSPMKRFWKRIKQYWNE